jgi:REP element-mobilizing transposase RayT
MPGLYQAAEQQLQGDPIRINLEQARALLAQFQETARVRGWQLLAVGIMANHVHLVVGVNGDPAPKKILGDFKAWGSRRLTTGWGKPPSDTWWTYGGSKRKLPDDRAVRAAIWYVRNQENPLVIWLAPEFQLTETS